jgi:hypothetical protein
MFASSSLSTAARAPFANTPWGAPQTVEQIAPGIWVVTTASHGGFYLEADALSRIPAAHQRYAAEWSHGFGAAWFEEDCAAYCVIAAYPEHFSPEAVEAAHRAVAHWIDAKAV